jgi:integrase
LWYSLVLKEVSIIPRKSSRRSNGEGSIYKRNGKWYGRFRIGTKKDGKPIYKYLNDRTQKALIEQMQIEREKYRGFEVTENSQMPLKEWLYIWLDEHKKHSIKRSTYEGYKFIIDNYFIPVIGDTPINEITSSDVQSLYNGLSVRETKRGEKLSVGQIRRIHTVLHQAMQYAKNFRYIMTNPTKNAILPPEQKCHYRIMNNEQLLRFMNAIKEDNEWCAFFHTEMTTGLRLSEICGLRVDDYDIQRRRLKIRHQLMYVNMHDYESIPLKTEAGARDITVPSSTARLLNQIIAERKSEWLFYNRRHPEHPLIPGNAYIRLQEILQENDIPPMRFHDLRHTFATHAIDSGVDPKTLSRILGHTRASFTLDRYTHVTKDMLQNASNIASEMLNDLSLEDL